MPYAPSPTLVFSSVVNDSRDARPGSLFLAIEAARDGHDFIADSRARGAIGVLARRAIDLVGWLPAAERSGFAYLIVDDPVRALARVAAAHRSRLELGVIGITGSVGKTSTKEVVVQVLRRRYTVLGSQGNLNNEIGLPITLLEADARHDRAVLEMGAYHPGEIDDLCRIAEPQVGIVTTIGPTHLESFGSLDAIEATKGELVEALPETGLAVLNGDDERVRRMADRAACPVVMYGLGAANVVRAANVETRGLAGIAFELLVPGGGVRVETPLVGRHSVYACLAAAAVALADDVDEREIALALGEAPARLRLRQLTGRNGAIVLDDTYNAAPISMRAALDVLAQHGGRRVAILGDMLELGEIEREAHSQVGEHAASAADVLYAVGPRARDIGQSASRRGLSDVHFADSTDDVAFEPRAGDLVLVKASRGMALERVVNRLIEPERA
jgi:UDP-N-acetylmuramoyl-tripeptide--D-alanyl-D-alanine ligase